MSLVQCQFMIYPHRAVRSILDDKPSKYTLEAEIEYLEVNFCRLLPSLDECLKARQFFYGCNWYFLLLNDQ